MSFIDVRVEDLIKLEKGSLVSGPFGSNISSKFFVSEGIPVIRGNNLSTGNTKYIDDGYVFITEQKAYELRNCIAVIDDIIFTAAGTLGQVGIITKETKYPYYIISNKQIRLRLNLNKCYPMFIYYYLSSPSLREYLVSQNKGSSVPLLTLGIIRKVPLQLPKKNVQKKIAALLSSYDDLIENNKRRIAILEKMAEEIYREWFVRFRFANYQNTEFEKGIPKGWSLERIDSLGKVITGKTPSTENQRYYGGKIPFVKTPDMHGNMFIYETEEKLTLEGLNSQPSQIIPANAISVSCIGTGGIVSIVTEKCSTNQQINSVVLKNSKDLEWGFFTVKCLKETIQAFGSTGTTMTNLSKGKFAGLKVIVPPKGIRENFHEKIFPLFEQIKALSIVNMNLTKTRNQLLPRLISGKLSVENLDIQFPLSMREEA